MARNVVVACLAALVLSTVSGCGTVVNLVSRHPTDFTDATKPYGGVFVDGAFAGDFAMQPQTLPVALFWLIDLPFSFVGDTVTLPYVLYLNAHKGDPAAARPEASLVEQAKFTDLPGKPVP
jgi:uncharacterized protein YceK